MKPSSLRNVLLLVKDSQKATKFFRDCVGLSVIHQTDTFSELGNEGNPSMIIKEAPSAAHLSTGYAPFLNFNVDDLDRCVMLSLQEGAMMDGAIKYPAHGKFAALRSPDGFMIGLFQPADS